MVLFMKSRLFPNLIAVVVSLFLLLQFNSNCYAQTDSPTDSLEIMEAPPAAAMDSLKDMDDSALVRIDLTSDSDKIVKWKQNREFSYIHYLDSLLRNQKDIKSDRRRIGYVMHFRKDKLISINLLELRSCTNVKGLRIG